MTINFYLDSLTKRQRELAENAGRPLEEVPCRVLLLVMFGGQRLKLPTGHALAPRHWVQNSARGSRKQRVKSQHSESVKINLELDEIELKAKAYCNELRKTGQPLTKPGLQTYLLQEQNDLLPSYAPEVSAEPDFFALFEEWIQANLYQKAKGTLKHYRTAKHHLEAFQQERQRKITLQGIDKKFYDELVRFYLTKQKLSNNTIGNQIKQLKVFLNYLLEHGYAVNPAFQRFKKPSADTEVVFLTEAELTLLYQTDFSDQPRLEHVRDLFVFQCETGLRYSDLENLKPENIQYDPHGVCLALRLTAIKTRGRVLIPLQSFPRAVEILRKYEGHLPPRISNQKMNDYLKELAQRIGLLTPIQLVHFSGNQRKEQTVPKWQLISTHTARRTFVTLALARGIRPEVIMQMTGHKDIKTLMRYVKITEDMIFTETQR
ncbi:Site-specific recombinase XerD [Catalinimonas alkaloidigena]|uniref:Site-specific recombinase XerD n=1 Tax=Catalinimonas alkaloidigena TaxID=1075417 RepID=A0A1G9HPB7_9BACT|nr:site-specific integrase [Catalinimonas alkaloidigena]SDL14705.1 Site-specific recombinase XerD [Catalinimonas alkaloidigena]